ncbi:uncharacterized protein LOC132205220 [Neocloeon triangulifer]|uniref:uncharacterized protein LOC132205220 n=1 Tax=Neocloeon triangulifer TaxID=2078957 RepID=UPI00286F71E8|nr:uncharacterized protein LOC132205220 [Neocloeon triangulifer]
MVSLGFWEVIRPLRRLLAWSGQLRPPRKTGRLLLWVATTGSLVLLTVLSLVQLVIEAAAELGSALEIVTILTTFVESCFRVAYLSGNHKNLFKLMIKCQTFPVSTLSFTQSENTLKAKVGKRSRRVIYFFYGYVFFVLSGYLSLPFLPRPVAETTSDITASIVREYPLYLPMWTPFGPEALKRPPFYQMAVIWQAWSFVVLVTVFCGADCLLYSFVIFIHEAMQHLQRTTPGKPAVASPKIVNSRCEFKDEYEIWIQQHQFVLQ